MSNSKAVTEKQTTAVSTEVDYGAYEGLGYENQSAADIAIPVIDVLQNTKRKDDPRRDDPKCATVGDLFNTLTREVIPGDVGVVLVPCITENVYIEWTPKNEDGTGGGGPHNFFTPEDPIVVKARETSEDWRKPMLENGNQLTETFQIYGLLLDKVGGAVIGYAMVPFTSSKIKAYKAINTRLQQFMLQTEDGRKVKPPLFAHQVRLGGMEVHDDHDYAVFTVVPAIDGDVKASLLPGDSPILEDGDLLRKMVLSGAAAKRVVYESTGGEDTGASGGAEPVDAEGKPLF